MPSLHSRSHLAALATVLLALLALAVPRGRTQDNLKQLVPAAEEGKQGPGQGAAAGSGPAAPSEATLPPGVKAVWDLGSAYREKTATRERVCLNGLWRWQPARHVTDSVPTGKWGFFKVPAFWPGTTNYIQEDCQTLHVHPSWKDIGLRGITAAWYQREITVPEVGPAAASVCLRSI
jgi:hypothetical protein